MSNRSVTNNINSTKHPNTYKSAKSYTPGNHQHKNNNITKYKDNHKAMIMEDSGIDVSNDLESVKAINHFTPVSVILSTNVDRILNKKSGYEINFNNGIMDGDGVSINKSGNILTFKNEGSYRLELCGYVESSANCKLTLVYHTDINHKDLKDSGLLNEDIKCFSKISLKNYNGTTSISGSSTILPIFNHQSIRLKLIPSVDEEIILSKGCRLLIYRTA